jgi:hypothetical protein
MKKITALLSKTIVPLVQAYESPEDGAVVHAIATDVCARARLA